MRLSKAKVEQITNKNEIIEDFGEILTPNEIKEIILTTFKNSYEHNGYIYSEFEKHKFCIFAKNISYLGNPHPKYKKRIQIPNSFIELFKKNKIKNITTLLVGVYSYKGNILICDFNTDKYIKNKAHNSSAHVYSIDLINGQRNGLFKKKDINDNVITVFDTKNIEKFLNYKFYHNESSGIEVFDTFDEFFISIAKDWFGIDCYYEMIENNFENKYQPEWPGFYLEYKVEEFLRENNKTGIIQYSQNKKDGQIDLDLYFPKMGMYGDLKAHSTLASSIQGNDYETIMKLLETDSIYYVVATHTTEKDKDYNYEVTEFWNQKQNKENIHNYGDKMKHSVHLTSYYILEINKYNKKYLKIYNQGKNSNGKPRNPKIMISDKDLNNFIVHIVEFDN